MFKNAYDIASKFTLPLVVTIRFHDKTVESGLGSFIVLNNEGWLMSVAHNFDASIAFTQHQKELATYNVQVDKINSLKNISHIKRKRLLKKIKPKNKWVIAFNILLSGNPVNITQSFLYHEHDFAIFKVDASAVAAITTFPKIKDYKNISPGTSLCKLGFPFTPVNATFDELTNSFVIPPNLLPVPLFPIEGIYTRNIFAGKTKDGTMDINYLETSSPGLKGQSGGPIFDTDGNIYAIQSKNTTVEMGFKGVIEVNKKKVEENQFINFGIGVHPKTIFDILTKHNINFDIAP
jgi:hypothetical protein